MGCCLGGRLPASLQSKRKMNSRSRWRSRLALCALLSLTATTLGDARPQAQKTETNPWTPADAIEPGVLADELAHEGGSAHATILYVGFTPLFEGAHISGAVFHGTASSAQGLADLKKWAAAQPHNTSLFIYCGCCPFGYCPNIRPAFVALHSMGFTHLRVLVMPNSFATDWVDKGYPVEKGHK
jgi:thiosulfate/3-mercaptopyruvate sulfurtransferase